LHENVSVTTILALLLILSGVFLNTSARGLATPVAPDEVAMELEA
jgi:hypothetical protein